MWLVLTVTWVCGSFLLIYGCRIGPLIVVASFRYMLLVWGAVASYFVFGNVPDRWSILGAGLIGASGLYVFYRETVRKRPVAAPMNIRS
jgi:drug/metabolite transporter (DMT)-like permease